ncbi:MAG: hypothetical protein NT013_23995 [Planctomycetia bacterium]|nr:hypothetical protein [Planctomycetia bacterium]
MPVALRLNSKGYRHACQVIGLVVIPKPLTPLALRLNKRGALSMIHGYHVIIVTYGSWLPNDPRGSWSDFVAAWELYRFGRVPRAPANGSLSNNPQLAIQRGQIQRSLKYPAVQFTGQQARAVGNGFLNAANKNRITIWACSILPEHVHLVLGRCAKSCETKTNFLKGEATKELNKQNLHPLAAHSKDGRTPTPWAKKHWQVYLDSEQAIENAMAYVLDNPEKEGKPRQTWPCVTPFTGIESNIVSYP